jgi:DNA mismatch repair protein MutL
VPAILGEKGLSMLVESLEEDAPQDSGPEEKLNEVTASIACKAAIKDGELLEDRAAATLIAQSLTLPLPRCPHGRPIWIKLDRKTLERMVGRES